MRVPWASWGLGAWGPGGCWEGVNIICQSSPTFPPSHHSLRSPRPLIGKERQLGTGQPFKSGCCHARVDIIDILDPMQTFAAFLDYAKEKSSRVKIDLQCFLCCCVTNRQAKQAGKTRKNENFKLKWRFRVKISKPPCYDVMLLFSIFPKVEMRWTEFVCYS